MRKLFNLFGAVTLTVPSPVSGLSHYGWTVQVSTVWWNGKMRGKGRGDASPTHSAGAKTSSPPAKLEN